MRYTHFQTPFIQLENYGLDYEIVNLIPKETAEHFKIIAIDKVGNILTVGIVEESGKTIIPFLAEALGMIVMPIYIHFDVWSNIIHDAYIQNNSQPQINYIG